MAPPATGPVRVAIVGAAFTANRGSASMLQAVIEGLPGVLAGAGVGRECRFAVLTTYPKEDRAYAEAVHPGVAVVPYRPWELIFPLLPLALGVAAARALGVPPRLAARLTFHPALREIARADVVVDVAGISFVDGRGLPLVAYNVLMTGIPRLLGAKVVKCAQALGPFRSRLNRTAARAVLPRLAAVVARGESTRENLRRLGLENAESAADLAFTLDLPDTARDEAAGLLRALGVGERFVVVVPSAVVEGYCAGRGIDYRERLVALIRGVLAQEGAGGAEVLIVPHAARPGRPASRMNDLPLARALHEGVDHPRCHLLDPSGSTSDADRTLRPDLLRAVIERAEALVSCRFHAMISALAVATPVLVIGWSHKYAEVLRGFGLERWTVDHAELGSAGLLDRYRELRAEAPAIRERITAGLPAVRAEAEKSFRVVARVLEASP